MNQPFYYKVYKIEPGPAGGRDIVDMHIEPGEFDAGARPIGGGMYDLPGGAGGPLYHGYVIASDMETARRYVENFYG